VSARHLLWLVRGANGLLRLLPLLGAGALGLLGAGALGGCDLHQEGVRPPDNRIFFPGGAAIEGGGDGIAKWLYVVNSNSDLRYSAGTVIARLPHDVPPELGSTLYLAADPSHVFLFDSATGARLR